MPNDKFSIDRSAFSVVSFDDQDEEEKRYWQSKLPYERLEAVKRPGKYLMATIPIPSNLSAFLRLLDKHELQYLLLGGYAVGNYGYVRATADMDVWIRRYRRNAERLRPWMNSGAGARANSTPTCSWMRIASYAWECHRCESTS